MRTSVSLALTTAAPNRNPVWDTSPIALTELQQGTFPLRPRASDPDGDPLVYSVFAPFDRAQIAASLVAAGLDPSGADGFSFDAETYSLRYDGRPLGMAENTEVLLETGLRLSADDGRV